MLGKRVRGYGVAQDQAPARPQDAVHLGQGLAQLRGFEDVEQAVLGRHPGAAVVDGQPERVALADADGLDVEPRVQARRLGQVGPDGFAHLGHRLDSHHRSRSPAEVRELEQLEAAPHPDVDDARLTGQVARVNRRPASVVHLEHARGNPQLGKAPDRARGAAQALLGGEGGASVEVLGRVQVAHGSSQRRARQAPEDIPNPSRQVCSPVASGGVSGPRDSLRDSNGER